MSVQITDAWRAVHFTEQGLAYHERCKDSWKEEVKKLNAAVRREHERAVAAEQQVQNMDRELCRMRREIAELRSKQ